MKNRPPQTIPPSQCAQPVSRRDFSTQPRVTKRDQTWESGPTETANFERGASPAPPARNLRPKLSPRARPRPADNYSLITDHSPLALLVALPLLLAGCSSFRTELGQPRALHKGAFVEGTTTVQTVMRELGPPTQVSVLPDGFACLYEHSEIREFQLGLSVNLPVLRFLKYIRAWNHVDQDILLMTFDNQGRLRGIGGDHWKEDLGGGTAVQLILSVVSLSDSPAFRKPADPHSWGAASLRWLPSTLNAEQGLRSGTHGLQLRPALSYAGQQTLEMAPPKKLKSKKRPDNSQPF